MSVQNWHEEFDEFWPEHSTISKICTLIGCFWAKYIMFELKKYRGVIFDGTEYWWEVWRKNELCFQKWYEKFEKFSPEHLKVSKLGLWWDSFIQSRKCISLKLTGRGIDLSVENWHEELDDFWPEHSKVSKTLHFNGLFLIKVFYLRNKRIAQLTKLFYTCSTESLFLRLVVFFNVQYIYF